MDIKNSASVPDQDSASIQKTERTRYILEQIQRVLMISLAFYVAPFALYMSKGIIEAGQPPEGIKNAHLILGTIMGIASIGLIILSFYGIGEFAREVKKRRKRVI